MKKIACVILSGGKSQRMGQDKATLPFLEGSLLEYQYTRIKSFGFFDRVYVSCKQFRHGIWGEDVLLDHSPVFSPLHALHAILSDSPYCENFILSVDTPFVSQETIKAIITPTDTDDEYDARVLADSSCVHHVIGIYKKSALLGISEMLSAGIHRLSCLKDFIRFEVFQYGDIKEFHNLNTPQDYQQALKRFI